VSGNR